MSVGQLVSQHRVVAFTQTGCPYCMQARALLQPMVGDAAFYELDQMPNGNALRGELAQSYGHTTVPAIFINGQFIGGYDNLAQLNATGQLQPMLM